MGQRHSGAVKQLHPARGERPQPTGGGNTSSYFVNLRNGVNWGAWRLRHDGVWNRDEQGQAHWRTLNSYVQRDITQLNGLLTLGDAATPGDIFDSVPLRGLLLASVEEMYPDSLRGYSPVVRGIARSNAEVIVRQNGVVIDQRYVPPGRLKSAISMRFPAAAIWMSPSRRATARNSACWCRLPRCRCCSAKGGSATAWPPGNTVRRTRAPMMRSLCRAR